MVIIVYSPVLEVSGRPTQNYSKYLIGLSIGLIVTDTVMIAIDNLNVVLKFKLVNTH